MKKAIKILAGTLVACLIFCLPCAAQTFYGTDISHHNNVESWQELKSTQYGDFVYIKVLEGNFSKDEKALEHIAGARSVGMPYGYYFYFHPYGITSARFQADRFCEFLKTYEYNLIPAVDVENTDGRSPEGIQTDLRAFTDEYQSIMGSKPMIYTYFSFANDNLGGKFVDCPLWIARYNSYIGNVLGWGNNHYAWQFSGDTAHLGGVKTVIDLNAASEKIFVNKVTFKPTQPQNSFSPSVNSRAGKQFQILNSNGSKSAGHYVFSGDKLKIVSVSDFNKQLLKVEYPVHNYWVTGYVSNNETFLHNIGYNLWRNGGTPEPVYDINGNRIGTIYPYEYATILGKASNGMTAVLYTTGKGGETKSGFVKFSGLK